MGTHKLVTILSYNSIILTWDGDTSWDRYPHWTLDGGILCVGDPYVYSIPNTTLIAKKIGQNSSIKLYTLFHYFKSRNNIRINGYPPKSQLGNPNIKKKVVWLTFLTGWPVQEL